jgi:hypothetical protein
LPNNLLKNIKSNKRKPTSKYKASVTKEYEQYEQAEKTAYAQFKEDVEKQWETFRILLLL